MMWILLFINVAFAQCDFPVPAETISVFASTGISKRQFDRVMNEIERTYTPIFESQGCPLTVHRSWSDGTVNAQAWRGSGSCHIEMFGGLARYPGMTEAAFKAVALHEIGHHLAGYPTYLGSVLSCEGQSDYFSGAAYPHAAGALALTRVLAKLAGEPRPTRPGPKLAEVPTTYCSHPQAQCRLQSFDAGRWGDPRPRCWFSH